MKTTKFSVFVIVVSLLFWMPCGFAKSHHRHVHHHRVKHHHRVHRGYYLPDAYYANISDVVKRIQTIEQISNSIIGVTAVHVETNTKISVNGEMPFFMASTVKVPIAITLLHKVDENQESLTREVKLNANDAVVGSGGLHQMLRKGYIKVTVLQLLRLMVTVSDNTASDAILRQVHGPSAVLGHLNSLGFNHILTKRSLLEMFVDADGADASLLYYPHTYMQLKSALSRVPMQQKVHSWRRFQTDLRDTTTPDDMANLLAKLYKGEILSNQSTQLLLDIMAHCQTGRNRIRGLLPPHLRVAHKTGTWSIDSESFASYPGSNKLYRFVSDVGIITLPKEAGHIAIAVYLKSTGESNYDRSYAIAQVSKAIYDYFLHMKQEPPIKKVQSIGVEL